MTLNNLKYALILNNMKLLDRLKSFLHTHENLDTLNGLSANDASKLLFNGNLVSEENNITNEEIKQMVDQVMAELDKESPDPTNPDPTPVEPEPIIYGYKKTIGESDPDKRIEYINDCTGFIPAYMNYETNSFEYGSWKDAFFMKIKPVMLNFDGTVAYELDPDDYTKKKDGTASDIDNIDFPGNAMVGIPTIWFKRETIDGYEYVYVSDKQVDNSYKAYAHTDEDGNIMKYTYVPIYNGFIDTSGKLRSISGVIPKCSTTMIQEITAAELNNPENKHMWNIETRTDIQMLNDLCVLIGKSSNTQITFGTGNTTGSQSNVKQTGMMNSQGLFYGDNANNFGVKVFGIEHFWGNRWGRIVGSIYVNNKMKVKMTYGTQDGSTGTGYNIDGTGYIEIPNSTISGTSNGYISETFNNEYGRFVTKVSGAENTYDCDGCWFANGIMPELHGGFANGNSRCGGMSIDICDVASRINWSIGASVSCKPGVKENILIPVP